jgi:large subunit ribosomal protein L21
MVGGKQYKVTKGDLITTETLQVEVGDHIVLDKVLLVGTKDFTAVGTPLLTKAKVAATIEEQTRLAKVSTLFSFFP